MPDKDKVVLGLSICADYGYCDPDSDIPYFEKDCPYYSGNGLGLTCGKNQLLLEALELLRPVPVRTLFITPYKSSGMKHGRCPGCDALINSVSNKVACGRCGMMVSWDD